MAEGTTLLSYEMGWQLRLFDLMAAAQQANDYVMACNYGIAFLTILGLKDQIPQKRIPEKAGSGEEFRSLQDYYTQLLMTGITKIGDTISSVRTKYKKDTDVPKYVKPQEIRK